MVCDVAMQKHLAVEAQIEAWLTNYAGLLALYRADPEFAEM